MLEPIHRISRKVLRADRPDPFRNHEIDPVHATLSAITVAGIAGSPVSSARIRGSTSLIADGDETRSYFGGPSLANALATVSRATLSCRAIARCDGPLLR